MLELMSNKMRHVENVSKIIEDIAKFVINCHLNLVINNKGLSRV